MERRRQMFDDFQRKYQLDRVIRKRYFLGISFVLKLTPCRIQIDGLNVCLHISLHEVRELVGHHQTSPTQLSRVCVVQVAQESQQASRKRA